MKYIQNAILYTILFWALSPSVLLAQINTTDIKVVDSILADYILTVEFRNSNDALSMPILDLKRGSLTCEFDDNYGDYIDYYYTVRHCDRNWNFTQNVEIADYLDGPEELQIENFASSVNTVMNYNHYSFQFPNRDIQFRWSGNYLLIIYDDDGNIVITKKFYVVDFEVPIEVESTKPNGIGTFDTHQAFRTKLNTSMLNPVYPIQELFIQSFQNRMNENPSEFKQPFRAIGKYAELSPMDQFSFKGYKEYRAFDTRSLLTGGGEAINHIDISKTHAIVLLNLDKKQYEKGHFSRRESNGAFVIKNNDPSNANSDISSEYANILFNLKSPFPESGDIYLVGAFNDFKKYPQYRMEYLTNDGAYTLDVPMKQGYYNYFYAFEKPNGELDISHIEGSSYETENDYHIFVYYRPLVGEYDRISGYFKYKP